jgi:hypothetical protein
LSEHAHGDAIDINPAENPNQSTLKTDLPANIRELAHRHGLKWGGDFHHMKDPMHFEVDKGLQSFLAGARQMLTMIQKNPNHLAMLTNGRSLGGDGNRQSSDAGTRIQNTKILINSTDPHSAASEIARHMKKIHSDVYRDFA